MNDCESPALEREGYNLSKMKGGHLVGFQFFRDPTVGINHWNWGVQLL